MKVLFFSAILLLLSIQGFSQSQTSVIKGKVNRGVDSMRTNTYLVAYDFQKGVFEMNHLKIRVGTPTVFKISNINRLAYSVDVKSKDSVLAETNLSNLPFGKNDLNGGVNNKVLETTNTSSKSGTNETVVDGDVAEQVKTARKTKIEANKAVDSIKAEFSIILNSSALTQQITEYENQLSGLEHKRKPMLDAIAVYGNRSRSLDTLILKTDLKDTTSIASLRKNKVEVDLLLIDLKKESEIQSRPLDKIKEQLEKLNNH